MQAHELIACRETRVGAVIVERLADERPTPEVEIPGPGVTFIRLAQCERPHDDALMFFLAQAASPGLRAEVAVETIMGDGLADFLENLVTDFRGWRGTRTWTSHRADLRLEAIHSGHWVDLSWTLRSPNPSEDRDDMWSATVRTPILPGEALTNLAREVRSFLYDE
ncbi:DUF6228 family protein [Nonomuraea polychroma]|uniref:DUF6228 family protein n=1 Tax=Nonomuraea polychroma TaxID=46176 RepID=UPI000FDD2638|nr:DUF6228 family protein [Nonomuraea polychroma]